MRKLAGLAAAGAMLLGMAGSVLAFHFDTVVVNGGWADQTTTADADANTGAQKGGNITIDDDGAVVTGNALAVATALAVANQFTTVLVSDCGCWDDLLVLNLGGAFQTTTADADANTGAQKGGNITIDDDGVVVTGSASAVSQAVAWANIFTTQVISVAPLSGDGE